PVRRCVEVVGELPDSAEVGLLGVLAEAGQLKVLEHHLAESRRVTECRRHLKVLSQRSEEAPLQRSLCHDTATGQGWRIGTNRYHHKSLSPSHSECLLLS